jgi:hypothetical protein
MAGRPPKSITELSDSLSMNGELNDTLSLEVTKEAEQEIEPDVYMFELIGNFRKDPENGTIVYPPLSLNNMEVVYDERSGVQRTARLLNGVSSIWLDDQKDITDKYADRNRPNLTFSNGQLFIPKENKSMVQFLLLRSDFQGCKKPALNKMSRYRLVNTASEESAKLKLKQIKKEASDLAWDAEMEDLRPHAIYLGISMSNHKGLPKTDDALRADYVDKAEAQPDLFMRTVNNPKIKTYAIIKKAFEDSVIVFVDGQVLWNDTKTVIANIPANKTAPDYLAELMLTREGKELKVRLENL